MTSPEIACDDEQLRDMLQRPSCESPSEALLEHVEHCERCQAKIEQLAANAEEWRIAGEVLATSAQAAGDDQERDRDERGRVVRGAHWAERPVAWTASMAKQLLSPSSHPEMLGRLGRYEVERLIGAGGMGVVFKAVDTELNRVVAIKVLAPYLAGSGPARQRFAREARAAAAVVHDHVVPIHNVETEQASPYLVMQYVAGESLQARLDRKGPLELCEILRIGRQVAAGLAAAHDQGLVHRDIKPLNILLEPSIARALITDFGLARAADDASITNTGFHPGTPQYMSPEQVAGETVDARSDLFSLGSVLYAMGTGRSPFRAETSLAVMRRIADSQPRCIREINPAIPEWFERIVMKLLQKNPDQRFASASEVETLLEKCLAHVQQPTANPLPAGISDANSTHGRAHAHTTRRQSRSRVWWWAIGLIPILIGVAVLLGMSGRAKWFGPARNDPDDGRIELWSFADVPNANPLAEQTDEPNAKQELPSVKNLDILGASVPDEVTAAANWRIRRARQSIDRATPERFEASIRGIIRESSDWPAYYRAMLMQDLVLEANQPLETGYARTQGHAALYERVIHQCAMAGLERDDEVPAAFALRLLEFATWSQLSMNTDDDPDWPAQRHLQAKLWLSLVERVRGAIDPKWDESDRPQINNEVFFSDDPKLAAEHARRIEVERQKARRYNEQFLARRLLVERSPRMEEDLIRMYVRLPLQRAELEKLLQQYSTDAAQQERIAKTVRLFHAILPGGTRLKYGWPDGLAEAGAAGVPQLIEAVRDKTLPTFIRHDGAWALGLIGDPRALPVLQEVAADEATPAKYKDIAREFVRAMEEKSGKPEPAANPK